MATNKKSKSGDKRAAKVAKRRKKQGQRGDRGLGFLDDSLPLGPLQLLRDLPDEVREELAEMVFRDDGPSVMSKRYPAKTQRMLDQAMAAETVENRQQNLRKVVKHDPDCIDAWEMLAHCQPRPRDAVTYLQSAADAARRAIPDFDECVGDFAEFPETVYYLECLYNLMMCQRAAQLHDAAMESAREVMRLDQEDGEGARYLLLELTLQKQLHDEAQTLIDEYHRDAVPDWAFGRLLLAVQTDAPEEERRRLLKKAHKLNRHVLDYLLGRLQLPAQSPRDFKMDAETIGAACASHLLRAWTATPGAISWLRKTAGDMRLLKPVATEAYEQEDDEPEVLFGPDAKLHDLSPHPQSLWIVGIHELPPLPDEESGRNKKSWAMYALGAEGPVNLTPQDEQPKSEDLWAWLVEGMHSEGRPEVIEFVQSGIYRRLVTPNLMCGVELRICEDAPPVDELFAPYIRMRETKFDFEALSDEDVLALPQDATDRWECDLRRMEKRIYDSQGELCHASVALIVSARDELVMGTNIIVTETTDVTLLAVIAKAMFLPVTGEPHRPGTVIVQTEDDRLMLSKRLGEWNINVETTPQFEVFEGIWEDMAGMLGDEDEHNLSRDEAISNEDQAAFYEAACEFYRSAPWQRWMEDALLRIDCPAVSDNPIYATVMGQSGIETGVSMLRDREQFVEMFENEEMDISRELSGYSLTFAEENDLPIHDLEAIEQFGWPIATPEAYPVTFGFEPGPKISRLSQAELQMVTAVMTALCKLQSESDEQVEITLGDVTVRCRPDGNARA